MLYINDTDKLSSKSYTGPWNELVPINVTYRDSRTDAILTGVYVTITGSGINQILTLFGNQYVTTINTTKLGVGVSSLLISATKANYTFNPLQILITVENRTTDMDIELKGNPSDTVTVSYGEVLNVTAFYLDNKSGDFLFDAELQLRKGETIIGKLEKHESLNQYNYSLYTATYLPVGVHFLTISAQKANYSSLSSVITVIVNEIQTNYSLYFNGENYTLDKTYTITVNQTLNINLTYFRQSDFSSISGATVDINGSDVSEFLLPYGSNNYSVAINTSRFNQGSNFLTIYAQRSDYQPQSISIVINIVQVQTNISFYVNQTFQPKDVTDVIIELTPLDIGDSYNFTVYYGEDDFGPPILIDTDVNLTGTGFTCKLNPIGNTGNYSIILNSTDLNWGVNYLTILAQKANYEPQTLTIKVEVVSKETYLDIFLDRDNRTLEKELGISEAVAWNDNINITILYEDIFGAHIAGANVTIEGIGFNDNLTETGNQYELILNSSRLGVGVIYLTINAEQTNYEAQTIIIKIQVEIRDTTFKTFVNGIDKTVEQSYKTSYGELITITVVYNDTDRNEFISDAVVSVNGTAISSLIEKFGNTYQITISSATLGTGISFLTIDAIRANYTSQTIVLKVQVVIRDTTFKTFVNGIDKTVEQSFKTSYNELITISIVYNDTDLNEFISDAIVSINGTSVSSLIDPYENAYQITINSATLGTGISFLTIEVSKSNYETHSLVVSIDVIERTTDFYLEINELNKTLDKSIEVPIRSLINVTISYLDEITSNFISGATVSLIGENLSLTLTENSTLRQYSVLVNSTDLDIGVRFLTVTAQKVNYESYSARLRIQVNRIRTTIEVESGNETINTLPGDTVTISVSLHDLDYGGDIENVTVTYSADFGQGELTDPDGDGVFEAVLTNVPEGTYQITISVYADDDYDFERIRLTLNAIRPPENVLFFQVLTFVGIGAAITIGGYLIAYQRVLQYPVSVRKIHKFKNSLKKKKAPPVEITTREAALESYFKGELGKVGKSIEDREKLKAKEKLKEIELPEQRESPTDISTPGENGDSPTKKDSNQNTS